MKPLVSIITPVYNAEAFLTQTIESVLAQSYENWEMLLVIDQKSSDGSRDIAYRLSRQDSRIRLLTNDTCLGVAANRNFGLEQALGEYVAFLDSDDLWKPEKLSEQISFMVSEEHSFSFHDYDCVNSEGIDMRRKVATDREKITYKDLLAHNYIGCLTVMLSRHAVKTIRFYKGDHEDYCFWLDLLRHGSSAFHLPQNLASYRILRNSRSANKIHAAKARWKILRQHEKLSFLTAALYLFRYTFSAILKRL